MVMHRAHGQEKQILLACKTGWHCFSVGGKGYIGLGYDGITYGLKDFLEYDNTTPQQINGHARLILAAPEDPRR
ncbi:hypothetical protein FRZ67_06230 [Panacibacter ginsenosidivorans]|uniref:Uncharacterized protein n=1 Tax=Panacibacter ginsenosidivorans TaxID=1813871 RepID=A0A5B8V6K3_9BACT|nr:hypothetical protein [Panacibacter ginsenosidivorans]QEC66912.1 hypothetical protein FRZ67_06230 [Panacibacter ginsenosidivorans]